MFFIVEGTDEIKQWLKKSYKIDLDQDYEDVQYLKNSVFSSLYPDAKKYLSKSTVYKYKNYINRCGNNRKRIIKQAVLCLGKAVFNSKRKSEDL